MLPALAGLVLLGSVARRRPMLTQWAPEEKGRRLTVGWGVGLLVVGALQGVGALIFGWGITDPKGFALRALLGFGGEALLAVGTIMWRRRSQWLVTSRLQPSRRQRVAKRPTDDHRTR